MNKRIDLYKKRKSYKKIYNILISIFFIVFIEGIFIADLVNP